MTKLVYLSQHRYPTQKAYGVTVGNTLSALSNLDIQAIIITWGKVLADDYGNKVLSLASHPLRLPLFLYQINRRGFAKFAFSLNQLIFGLYLVFKSDYRNNISIFWTREPLTLLFHSILFKNAKYLLEIHHHPSRVIKFAIRLLSRKNQIQIIVITEKSAAIERKTFPDIPVFVLPMGVPNSFFLGEKKLRDNVLRIGYIGKGSSSGFDNKLEIIIEAARIISDITQIKFSFIGLEQGYKLKLRDTIRNEGLPLEKFEFIDHVKHQDVANILLDLDVGVLPYANTPYNQERFPIKILEYAAGGLTILATDTEVHKNLLPSSFTFFFSDGDPNSLADAILKLRDNSAKLESMRHAAQEFASEFKYDARAKQLLKIMQNFL